MIFSDFFAAERRFYRRGASLAVCSALLLSLALPCAGASAANGNVAANGNLANGNSVVSAAGDADTFIEISDAAGLIAALADQILHILKILQQIKKPMVSAIKQS